MIYFVENKIKLAEKCWVELTLTEKEGKNGRVASHVSIPVQGPVVQSIVSLTSSLRGQLIKCFATLSSNTLKFFVEKIGEAFALHKLLQFSQQKFWLFSEISV